MRQSLPNFIQNFIRYQISDTASAALASSLLVDFGLESCFLLIDRSKIQREKKKHLKRIDFEAGLIHENITAIYFDGRKDETLKRTQNDSCVNFFGKSVKEEHITV